MVNKQKDEPQRLVLLKIANESGYGATSSLFVLRILIYNSTTVAPDGLTFLSALRESTMIGAFLAIISQS